MKRWQVIGLMLVSSIFASAISSCTTAHKVATRLEAKVQPQVLAAAAEGYEKGLKQGRLEAKPTPQACFSWWFSPEHTKDRVQQTRNYLCKSQGS